MRSKANLHTHTELCRHAEGSVDDYCRAAIEQGGEVLGISDHTPLPDNRWPHVRMAMSELENYSQQIEKAKLKYDKLKVLKSFECDYDLSYESFYKEVLLDQYKADYLVGAIHWFPHKGGYPCVYGGVNDKDSLISYTKSIVAAISSGLFLFIAHPDLFAGTYIKWDQNSENAAKEILQTAEEYNIALEINDLGYRKPWIHGEDGSLRPMYPYLPFWELAVEYNVKVVINSDAHKPQDVFSHNGANALFSKVNSELTLLDFY